MTHQLPERSELSQQEIFTTLLCHPVIHCTSISQVKCVGFKQGVDAVAVWRTHDAGDVHLAKQRDGARVDPRQRASLPLRHQERYRTALRPHREEDHAGMHINQALNICVVGSLF